MPSIHPHNNLSPLMLLLGQSSPEPSPCATEGCSAPLMTRTWSVLPGWDPRSSFKESILSPSTIGRHCIESARIEGTNSSSEWHELDLKASQSCFNTKKSLILATNRWTCCCQVPTEQASHAYRLLVKFLYEDMSLSRVDKNGQPGV